MLAAALLFVSSLAIILVGCHVFTNGVEWLGKRLGVSDGVVGSIFAGVGTALPETMIPLVAILAGGSAASEEIGIGAIVGAPFMLSTLTLPLAAVGVFVFTRMGRRTPFLNLDTRQMDLELRLFLLAFSITMLAAYVPWMPARWAMALFLVTMYAYYVRTTLRAETNVHDEEVPPLFLAPRGARPAYALIALQVVLALTAIVGGAHLFVDAVEDVALGVGISPLILSLLVTPVATELPEKLNSLIWLYQRKDQMAVGNIRRDRHPGHTLGPGEARARGGRHVHHHGGPAAVSAAAERGPAAVSPLARRRLLPDLRRLRAGMTGFRLLIAVGFAGFFGAVLRYLVGGWVHRLLPATFPYGTLTVNALGSLMLGALFQLAVERTALAPELRVVIGVGFLGAFTTFSTFSLETMNLLREGSYTLAGLNVATNLVLCLVAVWLGIAAVRLFG